MFVTLYYNLKYTILVLEIRIIISLPHTYVVKVINLNDIIEPHTLSSYMTPLNRSYALMPRMVKAKD